jgi:hypothetical protein
MVRCRYLPKGSSTKLIYWWVRHRWWESYLTHPYPIGSMYANYIYILYGNIYHQYTPNVSIYTSTMDPMGIWLQLVKWWDPVPFRLSPSSRWSSKPKSWYSFLAEKNQPPVRPGQRYLQWKSPNRVDFSRNEQRRRRTPGTITASISGWSTMIPSGNLT